MKNNTASILKSTHFSEIIFAHAQYKLPEWQLGLAHKLALTVQGLWPIFYHICTLQVTTSCQQVTLNIAMVLKMDCDYRSVGNILRCALLILMCGIVTVKGFSNGAFVSIELQIRPRTIEISKWNLIILCQITYRFSPRYLTITKLTSVHLRTYMVDVFTCWNKTFQLKTEIQNHVYIALFIDGSLPTTRWTNFFPHFFVSHSKPRKWGSRLWYSMEILWKNKTTTKWAKWIICNLWM